MPTDEELFTAWRFGDARAADVLIKRHHNGLLRFFEYRTGQAAEDLAQRTLAGCAAGLASFRGDGTFRAYLYGVARNQLLSFQRSRVTRGALSHLMQDDAGFATGLSTIMARQTEQRLLLQALVAIPESLQTPLALFYWEGLRAREIATILDCPVSTVTTRLARGRDVLREALAELSVPGQAHDRLTGDLTGWLRSLVPGTLEPSP